MTPFDRSPRSLLQWELRNGETDLRGYLPGHRDTTLFFMCPSPQGSHQVRLIGAFVPDDEEREDWDVRNAMAAAEQYVLDWVEMFYREFSPNGGGGS